MPRIPEGQFNTTPSTRVGAQRIQTPQATGLDRAVKVASGLTQAMAKLQDQTERTDAFNAANDARKEYETKRSHILTAMEAMDDKGNFRYEDPLSDPNNPTVIEGNIREELDKVNKDFSASQLKLGDLERSDIAMDLHQQYVGDDLNKLRIKAGKQMYREKKKKLTQGTLDVIDLSMTNSLEAATSDMSPELVVATVTENINRLDRTLASNTRSFDKEDVDRIKKHRDQMIEQTASSILTHKFDANSSKVVDQLLNRISDPFEKKQAQIQMEAKKKQAQERSDSLIASGVMTDMQKLEAKEYHDPKELAKFKAKIDKYDNAFYDPKYSSIDPKDRAELINGLKGKFFSTYVMQNGTDDSVDNLSSLEQAAAKTLEIINEGRSPNSVEMEEIKAKTDQFNTFLERQWKRAGIKGVSKEDKLQMFQLAKNNVVDNYSSLNRKTVETHVAKYPNQPKSERYASIEAKNAAMATGEPLYATEKENKSFKKEFTQYLKDVDPDKAFSEFAMEMEEAGYKYSRAVAQDLVKGNPKLEPYVAIADMFAVGNEAAAAEFIEDMHVVATNEKVFGINEDGKAKAISETNLEAAFNGLSAGTSLTGLRAQGSSIESSQKRLVMNRAKRLLLENNGMPVQKAMKKAMDDIGEVFYSVSDPNIGDIGITKPSNTKDFKEYAAKVKTGAALKLKNINLPIEDMKYIAVNFLKDESARVGTKETLTEAMAAGLRWETHPRKINTFRLVTPNGRVVANRNREELEYTAEDLSRAYDNSQQSGKRTGTGMGLSLGLGRSLK